MMYRGNTSTSDKLLNRDGSVSIHHQNILKLGIEIFIFVESLSPGIMKEIFQFREECHYQLRPRALLNILLVSAVFSGTEESIRFLGPKMWEIFPNEVQLLQSLQELKFQ